MSVFGICVGASDESIATESGVPFCEKVKSPAPSVEVSTVWFAVAASPTSMYGVSRWTSAASRLPLSRGS